VEQKRFPDASINAVSSAMEQGVAIRQAGNEYGATTQRPRRVGWLDLPLLRYAAQFTGRNVALTKPDVLDTCERIPICHSYVYEGPDYRIGTQTLKKGDVLSTAHPQPEILEHCVPQYDYLEGWCCDISNATTYLELPEQLRTLIHHIESLADVNVVLVSVGADREQTIVVNSPR
jgi:adenylosuccinate synthase